MAWRKPDPTKPPRPKEPEPDLTPEQKRYLENIKPSPKPVLQVDPNFRRAHFMIHKSDLRFLKQVLKTDRLSIRSVVAACLEAYTLRDPHVLKLVRDWTKENKSSLKAGERFAFSKRERNDIFDELENESPLEDPKR